MGRSEGWGRGKGSGRRRRSRRRRAGVIIGLALGWVVIRVRGRGILKHSFTWIRVTVRAAISRRGLPLLPKRHATQRTILGQGLGSASRASVNQSTLLSWFPLRGRVRVVHEARVPGSRLGLHGVGVGVRSQLRRVGQVEQ